MLHALHGCLGLPSDWNSLSLSHIPYDLLKVAKPSPKIGLWEWAEAFNAIAAKQKEPRILMGYSLGGRLAMHALISKPQLWSGAIIISACPFLKEDQVKRVISDLEWANRLERESWNSFIHSWNSQDIFKDSSFTFQRKEEDFNRTTWANAMRYWSLGLQNDLTPSLEALNLPILWIAGKKDLRYASYAASIKLMHPDSKIWIADNAGHRVPWECTASFEQQLNLFIRSLHHANCSKPVATDQN